jgi:hypothetical protein
MAGAFTCLSAMQSPAKEREEIPDVSTDILTKRMQNRRETYESTREFAGVKRQFKPVTIQKMFWQRE